MIEENITNAAPAVEAAPVTQTEPTSAATVEAPITSSPVIETPNTEAATPAEVVETTILTEAPVAEAPKAETPTVDTKNSDAPSGEPVKTEEKSQSDDPAPLPSFETFKLPDGVLGDTEALGAFTSKLADIQVKSKADQALLQTFGQELVDMHVAEVQKTVERMARVQAESFERKKQEWRQAFVNDPEIGGNRQQTTVEAAKKVIADHGGTPEQQAEFRDILEKTGLGNHPSMIRLLANLGTSFKEPGPLAASVPVREQLSKTQKLYGKTTV